MYKHFVLVLTLASSLPALATSDAGLTSKLQSQIFSAEVKAGFHFNDKAPNLLIEDGVRVKPQEVRPRNISFKIPAEKFELIRASLYVCDDALTFCEPKLIELKGEGKSQVAQTLKAQTAKTRPVKKNSHGFIEDNFEAALEQARKERKLVLVDFSARWCPGCVRLEKEIFDTKDFKNQTKALVKVRLDYDRFETDGPREKFAINGIPALVLMTPDQLEISRIVDYQPAAVIGAFLKDGIANPLPMSELVKKAESGESEKLMLGRRLYAADRFEEALKYLGKLQPEPIELRDAVVRAAHKRFKADKAAQIAFVKAARQAIEQEPGSTRSVVWRNLLVQALEPGDGEKQKIANEGSALIDSLLKDPASLALALKGDAIGEFAGYERLMAASQRAELISAAKLSDEVVNEAWKKVAQIGREAKIPVDQSGPSLRQLIFLVQAREYADAETLARSLLKSDRANAGNPEIHRRMIKILNEQSKFAEAIQFGKLAIAASFDKNEVWTAHQLARAYIGNGDKKEAKALIQSLLLRPDLNWSAMKSEQDGLKVLLAKASE